MLNRKTSTVKTNTLHVPKAIKLWLIGIIDWAYTSANTGWQVVPVKLWWFYDRTFRFHKMPKGLLCVCMCVRVCVCVCVCVCLCVWNKHQIIALCLNDPAVHPDSSQAIRQLLCVELNKFSSQFSSGCWGEWVVWDEVVLMRALLYF